MGKNKVLVKVHPEGKYVVDLDKNINMADVRTLPALIACFLPPTACHASIALLVLWRHHHCMR